MRWVRIPGSASKVAMLSLDSFSLVSLWWGVNTLGMNLGASLVKFKSFLTILCAVVFPMSHCATSCLTVVRLSSSSFICAASRVVWERLETGLPGCFWSLVPLSGSSWNRLNQNQICGTLMQSPQAASSFWMVFLADSLAHTHILITALCSSLHSTDTRNSKIHMAIGSIADLWTATDLGDLVGINPDSLGTRYGSACRPWMCLDRILPATCAHHHLGLPITKKRKINGQASYDHASSLQCTVVVSIYTATQKPCIHALQRRGMETERVKRTTDTCMDEALQNSLELPNCEPCKAFPLQL